MIEKKIMFLHILKDDKFAEPLINIYQAYNDITSEFVFYGRRDKLKYIKGRDDVEVFESAKEFVERLKDRDYNVVFFHSLQPQICRFIKSIPSDKIVIWWAFGYDIYGDLRFGPQSFVNDSFYYPETLKILKEPRSIQATIKKWCVKLYIESILRLYKKDILGRVDYFQPVIPYEFEQVKNLFKRDVHEYYLPRYDAEYNFVYSPKSENGNIIIGNSASAINNHADVWLRIKDYIPKNREVVMPLSYGDMSYAKAVKEKVRGDHTIRFLDTFLPRDEYLSIVNSCSYAVYGSIRQHAMGNIYTSLRNGVKVFLLKDSYIYKYLSKSGFVVFAIEDVDERSFFTPLSMEQQKQNFDCLENEREYRNQKGTLALDEIRKRINIK